MAGKGRICYLMGLRQKPDVAQWIEPNAMQAAAVKSESLKHCVSEGILSLISSFYPSPL